MLFGKKKYDVASPIAGKVCKLEDCPAQIFAKTFAGEGVVIFPYGNQVFAPFDAEIDFIFESKHAIGLTCAGVECLIHVGIDTNRLKGRGFDVKVKRGQKVKAGDLLLEFDGQILKEEKCIDATPVVFPNLKAKNIRIVKEGDVAVGDLIIEIGG